MTRCDVLIVGGGPAGSTCARLLQRAGWNVIVADRAQFPRDKVCAGWLTPDVFRLLELEPEEYRVTGATLQEISGFRTGVIGSPLVETTYPHVVSYAIRRREFDAFLLHRSKARLLEGTTVHSIRRSGNVWIVNDEIETPLLVGAGGHFCPVARYLRGGNDTETPVVAKEAEFRLDPGQAATISTVPELFFCRDLEGYAWSVRKGDYLNVGIGRRGNAGFARHVEAFMAFLEQRQTLKPGSPARWHGHAYMAWGSGARPLLRDGALVIGDAAGLAYPASGEGIKPAIESGRRAAETLIAAQGRVDLEALQPYAETIRGLHPPIARPSKPIRVALAAAGRLLLRSPLFTRHVVLDRWFLRAA